MTDHDNEVIIGKLKTYFQTELDLEIGQFEAQFLVDFFVEQLGPRVYNSGLRDARAVMANRIDLITEAIDELEQWVPVDTSG